MIFHMDYYFMLMINICQVNALTHNKSYQGIGYR
jgi:hypothetical protein